MHKYIILGLIFVMLVGEGCRKRHECATRKGKKKKVAYYKIQFQ